MKKIAVILSFLVLICGITSCKKKDENESTTQSTSEYAATTDYFEQQSEQESTQPTVYEPQTESQTIPVNTEPQTQAQIQSQTQSEKVVTYISENPDNYYICKVSEKYGSDKSCLIAFIKTNSSTPGATVLEFSGERDAQGKLITSEDSLKYVYDVPDSGTIKRAGVDGKNNDGYNYITAKTAVMLAQKYLIPSIDEMRENRRYEDYF